jgi:hypothetical protein
LIEQTPVKYTIALNKTSAKITIKFFTSHNPNLVAYTFDLISIGGVGTKFECLAYSLSPIVTVIGTMFRKCAPKFTHHFDLTIFVLFYFIEC